MHGQPIDPARPHRITSFLNKRNVLTEGIYTLNRNGGGGEGRMSRIANTWEDINPAPDDSKAGTSDITGTQDSPSSDERGLLGPRGWQTPNKVCRQPEEVAPPNNHQAPPPCQDDFPPRGISREKGRWMLIDRGGKVSLRRELTWKHSF